MTFFTATELENFYGKPIESISPTDNPLEEYIVGQDTYDCSECGTTLEVFCKYKDHNLSNLNHGFIEQAYCENCQIEFTRHRETTCDDKTYDSHINRVDEREEYICPDCQGYHAFTIPTGSWNYNNTAELHSLETIDISCPCGNRMDANNITFPEGTSCEKCERKYSFEVSNCPEK